VVGAAAAGELQLKRDAGVLSSPSAGIGDGSRAQGALWGRGFRPFFLLASAYAFAFLIVWLCVLAGWLYPPAWLGPLRWHAHEMLFGFIGAAVAGFLLTAVPVWTDTPPVIGRRLAGLAGLWAAGRVAMALAGWLPPAVVALVDLAFLPALIAVIAPPVLAAGRPRNYGFPVVLLALFAANAATHLEANQLILGWAFPALRAAVYLICMRVVVIGGRIIPAFTAAAFRRTGEPAEVHGIVWLDRLAVPLLLVFFATDLATSGSRPAGWAGLLAALVIALRMLGWQTRRSLGDPLLWSLHLGYAWLPVGFACLAGSDLLGVVARSIGLHALTAGAFGTMVLSVMSRVALGHTGRPLAPHRAVVIAYLLVTAGALLRTAGPLLLPGLGLSVVIASGVLWSAAFALYLGVYWPILTRPRIDGAPG
jgi:uncharacterized protein involved in response to NO